MGFHPEKNYIWGFGYPSLCKILLRAIGFHPEQITLYMGFRQSIFMQDTPSGYLSSPQSKAQLYMEMTMPWSYGI